MNIPIDPSSQNNGLSLDDVLNEYLSASKMPKHEVLAEWIQRFPEYETDLIDFTIAWSESEHLSTSARIGEEDAFVVIGMRMVHEAFSAKDDEHQVTKLSIRSILDEGRQQGISPNQLSDQLKLSISLIRKIDLRNILYSTIPLDLIESLARTIKRSEREIAYYLSMKPVIPDTVRYRSSKAPKVTEQRSFFDEVRRDNLLAEDQRNYWLSYEEEI